MTILQYVSSILKVITGMAAMLIIVAISLTYHTLNYFYKKVEYAKAKGSEATKKLRQQIRSRS